MDMEETVKENRQRLGREVKRKREEQGWTCQQVADMSGVKVQTIEKIEAGAFNVPADILAKVADVLGCDLVFRARKV